MKFRNMLVMTCALLYSIPSFAAPVKTHVAEFKVTGVVKDNLAVALQSLLASRLSGEAIRIVAFDDGPELIVNGNYIVFGKVFSLEAVVKNSSGKIAFTGFEQGESADDIIPAVSRLAQKLGAEISKGGAAPVPSTMPANDPAPNVSPVSAGAPSEIIVSTPLIPKKIEGDIIRPEAAATKVSVSGMIGQRLNGVITGIADVKRTDGSERAIAVALENELRLYSLGRELKLLYSIKDFGANGKIVAIDSGDLDADGTGELFVTIFQGDELASRVYLAEKGGFRRIASDLPYFFRAIALKGGPKKVYAQQMGRAEDYYGGLYEVVKKGEAFTIENQISLPKAANIFNTNQITGSDGKALFIGLNPDNYLTVSDGSGELLWKSSDKYGGSEAYFSRDDSQNIRLTGNKFRKNFLEQRITVTKTGEVIVPKNEGFFVLGDSRSFSKNSIYAFRWNGAVLEELWHTRLSQNYLSDYLYDEAQKELVLLEVVKKAGILDPGASAISVKRVE